jgi:hypothetical protein
MTEAPNLALRAEAWTALAVLRAALWLLPFKFYRDRFVDVLHKPEPPAPAQLSLALRATRAVAQAARFVPRATCLVQALALRWMLRRRGIGCEFRVGASRSEYGEFEAHAWIECGGKLLIGAEPAPRFTPLTRK